MAQDRAQLSSALREIWLRHLPLNQERLQALEDVASALERGELDVETRRRGEQEAHKLAGAAGSFGHANVTGMARELEEWLRADGPLPANSFRDKLQNLLTEFERTLN
jgi:HPt (histidine-containing phosphotransfer) domain-containing protein